MSRICAVAAVLASTGAACAATTGWTASPGALTGAGVALALAAGAAGVWLGRILAARRARGGATARAKLDQAARDLAASERYLEDFFETAPIGMHWVGPDGTILRANRAELNLLGYTREEYVGRNIADFHAERSTIDDMLCRLKRGETLREYEARLRCKDGAVRSVLVSSSALFESGRFVHTRCFTRDITDLRRGEQALLQTRGDLSLALSAANMGLWTRDLVPEDRVEWSPELCRLFGVAPEEFGRTEGAFLEFVHPDDRPLITDAVAAAIRDQSDFEVEFRYTPRGGDERWMVGRGRAEYDADGRPVRLAGIGMDVTERKRAADAVRTGEALYRAIVDSSRDCIKVLDLDGRLLSVNPQGLALLGVTDAAQIIGRSWIDLWKGEDRERAIAAVEAARSGGHGSLQGCFRTPSGEDRWWDVAVTPIRDASGGIVRLLAVSRDVTQTRRAEEEQRRAETHYRTIVETASEGVWLIDDRGRTVYVNERMAGLLGHEPAEIVGRTVLDFCFPEDVETAKMRIGRNFEGVREQFDFRFRGKDGRGIPVLASTNGVRGPDARVTGALGLFTDMTARKRAEEELRRFKFMCDSANDAYFFTDTDGRIRYANRTACELLGYTEEELLARSVPDVDALLTMDKFRALADDLARLGRLPPFQSILRRKDGGTIPMEFSVARVVIAGIPHFLGVGRDLTGIRHAEAQLRRSEETLRIACRSASAGAWDYDAATQRLTTTPEFRDLFGLEPRAEFGYEEWMELVHPDDRGRTDEQLRQAWTGEADPRLEYRIVRPDGAVRWIESNWITISGETPEGPRPVRMVGIAQDVTDRRESAAALERSEERYRLLAENVPQLIWTSRPDGTVEYVNQRWCDYTGLTAQEAIGRGWTAAAHPEDAAALEERWSRALHHAERVESEHRIRRADGQYRWFLGRATPLVDAEGRVSAWFGTATDIHEQKLAQERLAELNTALSRSNRDLEDFAHIAAHDLREPLRGMRLCTSFLLEDFSESLGPDGRRQLQSIDRLGRRMDELINSLLHYSLVGQAEFAVASTDLNQVVGGVLDSLGPVLREAKVQIRIPGPLPTMSCDAVRIGEVYRNLIGNAVKYNRREERWIEIGARPPENGEPIPVLYVRDNGIGIAPEHRETVFRIFKRLHARDEFGGGTGSGLALVKRIVERHGGRIWIESSLDEGSTFLFTLGKACNAPVEPAHSHR